MKRFGCWCGGLPSDTFTDNICNKQQPYTNWMFEMQPGEHGATIAGGEGFRMTMFERAGTPANVCPLMGMPAALVDNAS